MACNKCNTSNNTCGCKDGPVQVPFVPQCPPDQLFPDPSPCSETILDTCVTHRPLYTIENLINLGGLRITPETTLEQVYQMISLGNWDLNCPCPTDFHLSYLGTTSVVFNWTNVLSIGNSYRLEISENLSFGSISSISDITTNTITVQNLTSATTYYARLVSVCTGVDGSISATISFTTN
jgi:hypothetical protein